MVVVSMYRMLSQMKFMHTIVQVKPTKMVMMEMVKPTNVQMVVRPNQTLVHLFTKKTIVSVKSTVLTLVKFHPTLLQLIPLKFTVMVKPTYNMATVVVVKPTQIVVVVV